jgi:glucans biosynthesis protein C
MSLLRGENFELLEVLIGHWKGLRSVRGPVWYSSLLLLFDTAYSLLPQLSLPNLGFWPTMLLDVAASSLLRIPSLAHKIFAPLNVPPGYFPQYLVSYILGTRSSPSDLSLLTPGRRNVLLATSVLSGSCTLGLLRLKPEFYSLASLDSGYNPVALAYAVWNESTGFLLGASLMNLFEERMGEEVMGKRGEVFVRCVSCPSDCVCRGPICCGGLEGWLRT